MKKPQLKTVEGQPSYRVATGDVEAYVTEVGGQLGPVTFDRKGTKIKPYSVAPWVKEKGISKLPPILKVLRGDFFCLPFGGNDTPYKGEAHPIHGETANVKWKFAGLERSKNEQTLHLKLKPKVRAGTVDKRIRLVSGHQALYIKHTISGMKGPMNPGHHAMLKFPDQPGSGRISTSPIAYGQVLPVPAEDPAMGGYSCLKPGATFKSLDAVMTQTGELTDLSRFPGRRGFEDIVMTVADPTLPFAWTAVTFPKEGYVWFSIKDPQVLRNTVFWISNGGRHYDPWNGRHVNVMGLEDVTAYFHFGLDESAKRNPISSKGYPTVLRLNEKKALDVNYIMGVARIPKTFSRVQNIEPNSDGGLSLIPERGRAVKVPLDLSFIK